MPRIAINGFGRIGRNTLKAGLGKKGFDIVAINDLTDIETLAHLLRHDTVYGPFLKTVKATKTDLIINGKKIPVFSEKDPSQLPWKKLKVDVVLECTGFFRTREEASKHVEAGAKRVIISAPAKGEGVPTHVIGVNEKGARNGAVVINNASCTTNCVSPIAAVLQSTFGIKKAMVTTIHSYTAGQNLVDGPNKDLRRARAAAQNIVPTTTGAAIATTEAIPELKGKFDGVSIRVPMLVVSLSDFTFLLKRKTTIEEVNNAFRKAAKNILYKGILEVTDEELVSSDFIGNSASAIVDLPMTQVVDGDLVKVLAWYDNEWGYSNRLAEMAVLIGK
ncbi:MAG: type I glyceraldehyde-3-phosphate dehydrogenase [bacterium]|nr:type I glyceraldehyde-3-phosphate dehydrogenase [bacterium]